MHAWPAPDVPDLPGSGLPLRAARHRDRPGPADRTRPDGPDVRLRHHARTTRRTSATPPPTSTFDLVQPGLARRRARRALRAERHRRRRPAARARPARRRGLAGARGARDRPVPRGHDRARGAPAARATSAPSRRSRTIVDAVRRLRELGASYDVEGDTYFSVHRDPRFGGVGNLDDETMLALFAERGGDPERPGKKHPLDCLLWQAARPGEPSWEPATPSCPPAGRGGTSSARRSRWSTSATPSTCRAAAATWSSRTTR